jgi:tetratricopeptide (TPR) repeat protein
MDELKGIRVFIATPGGLEDERRCFRNAVEEVNREAYERGIAFIPVGWELTTAGLGRPQEQINEEVRRSDYLVLLLHDRWGTPPSSDGGYTSGTEEEYNVARECASDASRPMLNIAVLFKGVEPRQLSDPGEQLKQVLAFKQRLEEERGLLYKTFDSSVEFERELRSLLFRWLRDHENGGGGGEPTSVPPPNEPPSQGIAKQVEAGAASENVLTRAARLADEGHLTQAESLYAAAVVARTDFDAMTQYARFLRRLGRLDLAEAMSNRLLTVAKQHDNTKAMIEALSNLAIVYRKKGDHEKSISSLEEAVSLARPAGPELRDDLAFLLDNLGLTFRKKGQFDEALKYHLEALSIKRELDDPKSLATTLHHAAALLRQQGQLNEALAMTQEAVQEFRRSKYLRGEAQARANLGEILSQQGELERARAEYQASLELNERLNSPEGVGMNLWQLGRLALDQGDLDKAELLAIRAVTQAGDERGSRPEAVGAPMQLLGNVGIERGDFESAIRNLSTASELNEHNDLGAAWSLADLARAYAGAEQFDLACQALERAEEIGKDLANERFQGELDRAREQVRAIETRGGEGDSAR